jgi:hypothetical protein
MAALTLLPSFDAKNNRIIVCEGKTDSEIISRILDHFTDRLYIISAGGKKSLGSVRTMLGERGYPAIFVCDRDFDMMPSAATNTFHEQNPKTTWVCHDIEGYLLHSDWIYRALQDMSDAPEGGRVKKPNDVVEVEASIVAIATVMVTEYAGRQTLHQLRQHHQISSVRNALQLPDPGKDELDWLAYIQNIVKTAKTQTSKLPSQPDLDDADIVKRLESVQSSFRSWASNIETIRTYFSGKAIFKTLAEKWTPGLSSDMLRSNVLSVVEKYVADIRASDKAKLGDDPRLSDFAKLAEKSLSDRTQI